MVSLKTHTVNRISFAMDTKFSSLLDEFDIASKYHSPFPRISCRLSYCTFHSDSLFCLLSTSVCFLTLLSPFCTPILHSPLHFYPLRSFSFSYIMLLLSSHLGPLF